MPNPNKVKITYLHIEMEASQSDLSAEDFTQMLWSNLVVSKKHTATVNRLARDFNIYPKAVNVYWAIRERLFEGIAIY